MRRRVVLIILIIVFCVLAGILAYILTSRNRESRERDEADDELAALAPSDSGDGGYLADAIAANPDTVAWINVPGADIDFPVMYSGDNEYYLNHGFDKDSDGYGLPFLDYRCQKDFTDFNSIIYGHNIYGGGMFSGLNNFLDKDFFDEHGTATLTTNDTIYTIHIIACALTDSRGFAYEAVFLTDESKRTFLDTLKEQADECVEFDAEDMMDEHIVTLSTCSHIESANRTIVVGYLESK